VGDIWETASGTLWQLSSPPLRLRGESGSSSIGLITLDTKGARKRSAGNPHAASEVAGVGNGAHQTAARALEPTPNAELTAQHISSRPLRVSSLHARAGVPLFKATGSEWPKRGGSRDDRLNVEGKVKPHGKLSSHPEARVLDRQWFYTVDPRQVINSYSQSSLDTGHLRAVVSTCHYLVNVTAIVKRQPHPLGSQ